MKSNAEVSINNIYRLDGRVPLGKAIPFGLQHVLAMFVADLTPIVIVTAAAGLETSQTAALIQNAMFIAGVATLIQLYPVWRIGAKLPIVMGVSFPSCLAWWWAMCSPLYLALWICPECWKEVFYPFRVFCRFCRSFTPAPFCLSL